VTRSVCDLLNQAAFDDITLSGRAVADQGRTLGYCSEFPGFRGTVEWRPAALDDFELRGDAVATRGSRTGRSRGAGAGGGPGDVARPKPGSELPPKALVKRPVGRRPQRRSWSPGAARP